MKTKRLGMVFTVVIGIGLLPGFVAGMGQGHSPAKQEHDHRQEDEHAGEVAGHEDHRIVQLEPSQLANLDLGSAEVRQGALSQTVELPAEIRFLPQNIVHLTPRVPGIVTKVLVTQGDRIRKGQVLAMMESRDLGMAKSAYLAAQARVDLMETAFKREKRLWERKISPEQDYLQAKSSWQESLIEMNEKRQTLQVLGLSEKEIQRLDAGKQMNLIQYTFRAPFDGIVSDLHISKGEFLSHETTAFVIVDPSDMWVVGQVHERDLNRVSVGQRTDIRTDAYPGDIVRGTVDYIGSSLNNETRSAEARVVVPNADGRLKAGMFARLTLWVGRAQTAGTFLVPTTSLQRKDQDHVVFKLIGEGRYEMVTVTLMSQSKDFAEVRGELSRGDRIATGDIFVLKSELGKESMGEGHSH